MAATEAGFEREGDALAFAGALDRAAATALWIPAGKSLAGAQRIVLTKVTSVDSAGLALLAELAGRLRGMGVEPRIEGQPPGLAELRAAYRLGPGLEFPGSNPTE
ncbi:MAG: STAS domain-containing protein [Lysobacteraceae bacterium]|jgi:phospholipid transport system transporter-binding protein|nr:MAG: STAS domain-containing protein [Xanthomonadaceae bacterium]